VTINNALPLEAARGDGIATLLLLWPANTYDGTGLMPSGPN